MINTEELIDKLGMLKHKGRMHYVCYASTDAPVIDLWGDDTTLNCPYGGVELGKDGCCKQCSGKLIGYREPTDYDSAYNFGIDESIRVIKTAEKNEFESTQDWE